MTATTRVRLMVRNSEKSDFTQCRQKWHWAYVDRLRPLETGMNALIFGDIIHRSLAEWYIPERDAKKCVRGIPPAQTAEKIFNALEASHSAISMASDFEEHKNLAIGMMEAYVNHYGKDDHYRVIYPEMPFQYDVYNDRGEYVFTVVGTTDCLVMRRSTRQLGLLEHKTAARIETGHLGMDEQGNTYWTVVPAWLRENGIIKPNQDIHFMEFNFMKKATIEDDRPKNSQGLYLNSPTIGALKAALNKAGVEYKASGLKKEDFIALCEQHDIDWPQLGEVSATQGPDLFHREMVYRNEYQRLKCMHRWLSTVREMKLARRGSLEVYKEPSRNCAWCQYKDLCEMDEYGDDTEEFIKHGFTRWNPYADHIWSLALA